MYPVLVKSYQEIEIDIKDSCFEKNQRKLSIDHVDSSISQSLQQLLNYFVDSCIFNFGEDCTSFLRTDVIKKSATIEH